MSSIKLAAHPLDCADSVEANPSFIPLSDPDITLAELSAVETLLCSPQIPNGRTTEAFEHAFVAYLGRKYAVAVSSDTIGLLLALKALGIESGQEVIASPYSFRETVHAISLAGVGVVFSDIDHWSATLVPAKGRGTHHGKHAGDCRQQFQRSSGAVVGIACDCPTRSATAFGGFHRGDRIEL